MARLVARLDDYPVLPHAAGAAVAAGLGLALGWLVGSGSGWQFKPFDKSILRAVGQHPGLAV